MKSSDRSASNSLLSKDRQELDELFKRARQGAHHTASSKTNEDAVRRPKNQKQRPAGLVAKPRIDGDTSPRGNAWKTSSRHKQEEKLRKLRPITGTLQQRHQTEEGYRVYSLDELTADQPAGLELSGPCPFDCNCCFY
ncbi:hypothetical protein CCYA_CCYA01G0186 [Cyanidiococcus yangmingshanensis]|nr:hypothetical protein CCYA_CCYA01G0186 [Cyanidiococcus yangmingshanensis]